MSSILVITENAHVTANFASVANEWRRESGFVEFEDNQEVWLRERFRLEFLGKTKIISVPRFETRISNQLGVAPATGISGKCDPATHFR